jgi:hypothetical protein
MIIARFADQFLVGGSQALKNQSNKFETMDSSTEYRTKACQTVKRANVCS